MQRIWLPSPLRNEGERGRGWPGARCGNSISWARFGSKKCRIESAVLRAEGPVQPLPGPKAPDANCESIERPEGPTQVPSPALKPSKNRSKSKSQCKLCRPFGPAVLGGWPTGGCATGRGCDGPSGLPVSETALTLPFASPPPRLARGSTLPSGESGAETAPRLARGSTLPSGESGAGIPRFAGKSSQIA